MSTLLSNNSVGIIKDQISAISCTVVKEMRLKKQWCALTNLHFVGVKTLDKYLFKPENRGTDFPSDFQLYVQKSVGNKTWARSVTI